MCWNHTCNKQLSLNLNSKKYVVGNNHQDSFKKIQELKQIPSQERIDTRIKKFGKMGFWEE